MFKSKFSKQFIKYLPDIFALSVLLISGLVYVNGIESFLDILETDESLYLHWGATFPAGFPIPEWSPLYVLWYYFLSLFQPDTIELYFLNYKLMTILPSLFIYILLRVNKVQMIISFTVSLLFLLSFANFPTTPKVSHFALIFLLIGLIISSLIKENKLKLFSFTICLLIVSFIRPEFFLSFLLLSGLLAYDCLKEFYINKKIKFILPAVVTAVLCLILIYSFGSPAGSGERSYMAFGQHYARNWVKWNSDPGDPYADYKRIVKEDFDNSVNFNDAFLKNPAAILRHASENILNSPQEFRYMYLSLYPYKYPNTTLLLLGLFALVLFLIPFSRYGVKLNPKSLYKQFYENFAEYKSSFRVVFLALSPFILSVILIYPRRHYLLFPGLIFILMFVIIIFRNTVTSRKRLFVSILYICTFSLIIVRPLKSLLNEPVPANLTTLKYLRTMQINDPVFILDALGIFSFYQNENYNRAPEYSKESSFNNYLREWKINLIVLSEKLIKDNRFSNDPEWVYFINNSEEFGFKYIEVPDAGGVKLIVKKDLIE
jgi:hypothetical protein